MLNRVLVAAAASWGCSVTLGLLFAACASGRFSLSTLRLPGVVPVALLVSTVVALGITPIVVWASRGGPRHLFTYGSILWVILAVYTIVVGPRTGSYGLFGLLIFGVVGLVVLGLSAAPKVG